MCHSCRFDQALDRRRFLWVLGGGLLNLKAAFALLEQGVISVEETVLALIAGNIIAFPVRTLRHQLPRYMGIFQPEMGLKILFLGQFFRVASLVLTAGVFSVLA